MPRISGHYPIKTRLHDSRLDKSEAQRSFYGHVAPGRWPMRFSVLSFSCFPLVMSADKVDKDFTSRLALLTKRTTLRPSKFQLVNIILFSNKLGFNDLQSSN